MAGTITNLEGAGKQAGRFFALLLLLLAVRQSRAQALKDEPGVAPATHHRKVIVHKENAPVKISPAHTSLRKLTPCLPARNTSTHPASSSPNQPPSSHPSERPAQPDRDPMPSEPRRPIVAEQIRRDDRPGQHGR